MKSNTRTNTNTANNNETIEDTMYTNPCEINNTCDHETPICEEWADAPFCGGPSMKECAGGAEVPEDEVCPGNDTDALGEPDWIDEIHGDENCNTRAFATPEHQQNLCNYEYKDPNAEKLREVIENHTTTETADPVDTLPMTGINDVLFGGALGLIAIGTAIVRLVKN